MAHFVSWTGANLNIGARAISNTIQSTGMGSIFRFGIHGYSQTLVTVGPNDSSAGQVTQRESFEASTNGITWFDLVPTKPGNVMVEIRGKQFNDLWDSFQLVTKAADVPATRTIHGVAYDTRLDTQGIGPNWNATLELTLNILLHPAIGSGTASTVKDADDVEWKTRKWTKNEWSQYTSKFKKLVTEAFNEKFWLEAPSGIGLLQVTKPGTTERFRVNLHCTLKINIVSKPSGSVHHTVPVVYATRTTASPSTSNTASTVFRTAAGLYFDNMDNTPATFDDGATPPKPITNSFIMSAHEVGHLLGYHHPFETAPGPGGNGEYCIAGHPDCAEIMGLGKEVRLHYAKPWQNAAAKYFNGMGKGFNFAATDFKPSIVRKAPEPLTV